MYYEARYYDPVIGRFVSVDPLGMNAEDLSLDTSHSFNLYAYALDNPLTYMDPAGLQPKKDTKKDSWEPAAWKDFRGLQPKKGTAIGTKEELLLRSAPRPVGTREELFERMSIEEKGAAWLMTVEQYYHFVAPKLARNEPVGRPTGQFVIAHSRMEELLKLTGGSTKKLAELLGTTWRPEDPMVRIRVEFAQNIRTPQASTPGANPLFRPGGRTIGGIPEFIIDPAADIKVTFIQLMQPGLGGRN